MLVLPAEHNIRVFENSGSQGGENEYESLLACSAL
jgi:hypothetical protein